MLDARALLWGLPAATERLLAFGGPFSGPRPPTVTEVPHARFALQEIVNDFYDGFLSREDRRKIGEPRVHAAMVPPQVVLDKVGASFIPEYVASDNTVHVPAWLAQPSGVIGWVTLAHETSGHAVLNAYRIQDQLADEVARALAKVESGRPWQRWFEEAASDCLAVLNLGPMNAIGSIACLRALSAITNSGAGPKLACKDPEGLGLHPPPVLRAYIVAHTVGLLSFTGARGFAADLKKGLKGELQRCECGSSQLKAAEKFVELLVEQPRRSLNGHRFLDLQNWSQRDERTAATFKRALLADSPPKLGRRHYAAHALAAAVERVATTPEGDPEARVGHNLIKILWGMYSSPRGESARRELDALRQGVPGKEPSSSPASVEQPSVTGARSSTLQPSNTRTSKERNKMAIAKKKKKVKKKAKTTVNLNDGLSAAEAKEISKLLPKAVKKKLKKYW